jgi:hypothetical protein
MIRKNLVALAALLPLMAQAIVKDSVWSLVGGDNESWLLVDVANIERHGSQAAGWVIHVEGKDYKRFNAAVNPKIAELTPAQQSDTNVKVAIYTQAVRQLKLVPNNLSVDCGRDMYRTDDSEPWKPIAPNSAGALIEKTLCPQSVPTQPAGPPPESVAAAPAVPSVDAFTSANTKLLASLERAEKAGSALPRITDPDTRPIFEAAFDERVLSAFEKSDLNQLLQICSKSMAVAVAYSLHGIGTLTKTTAEKELPAASEALGRRNSETFQNELMPAIRFGLACYALEIPALTKFWERLPEAERTTERRHGVVVIRQGIAQVYAAALGMQSQSVYSAANRAIAINIVVQHADAFASALTPEDRKAVIGIVDKALASATLEDRAKLLVVRGAMSAAACTGLCAAN